MRFTVLVLIVFRPRGSPASRNIGMSGRGSQYKPRLSESEKGPEAKFGTFSDLSKSIRSYEATENVRYFVRESQTLENKARKFPSNIASKAPKELKYARIKFCCIKGGKNFKPRGKNIRETYTYRNECSANMDLKLSKCGQYLETPGNKQFKKYDMTKACTESLRVPKQNSETNQSLM